MTVRLKPKEILECRTKLLALQGGRCALCNLACAPSQAVLDHDHATGAIRASLHRTCNALLGKIENNYKRYGVQNLAAFCSGVSPYLQSHTTNRTGFTHPSHKTEDEKRLLRNKRARAARAKKGTT